MYKEKLESILKDKETMDVLYQVFFEMFFNIDLKIKKLDERAIIPKYGSEGAAGFDLNCVLDVDKLNIHPGETIKLETKLAMSIPKGYVGLIFARSGLGVKKGLAPANKVGVIDSDYRGNIIVALHNHSDETHTIENFERIAQMVVVPFAFVKFLEVDSLDDTERGDGGFGHSGRM